jgi:hypothetical protein
MALAWVSWTPDRSAFEIETGSNRFYELYLATRPELMQPTFAAARSAENWFSTRAASGLLPSTGGQALFSPPRDTAERFGPGKVFFMVKTFADARGTAPARSPVMGGKDGGLVMTDVDPDANRGVPMETTAVDFEELAARLAPVGAAGSGPGRPRRSRAASTGAGAVAPRPPARMPHSARTVRPRSAGRARRSDAQAAATALALTCRNLKAATARDPIVPGPSLRSVAEVLSTALALVPAAGAQEGGPSAAAVCNGLCAGRSPYGGQRELSRHIMRAASESRARSLSEPRSREQFLPALAALAPMLLQALPAILPVIMPLIQQLLGGLTKAKSLSGPAAVPADQAAALQQLLAAVAAGGGASPPPAIGTAPAIDPAAGGATAVPVAPALAPAADPAAAAAPGAAPGAAVSPDMAAALLGALQGGEGGGGAGGMLGQLGPGGPGHEIVKSIVDRLPIEKMFDGQAWIPKSNYDEWRSTLPWEAVLSLSDPMATTGALFVPGRKELGQLAGVKLAVVERDLTTVPGAGESWIFLADRPARIRVEVNAGEEGLSRPFVDVRVSRDGTPGTALWRSVFRLASLAPRERRVAVIELPVEILQTAARDGSETCASLRVVQESGGTYDGAELRACFHVVAPTTLVLEPGGVLAAAPELDRLAGLERVIPRAALGPDLRMVQWGVRLAPRAEISGLARHESVGEREIAGERVLEGGLTLSPVGVADLARRREQNELGTENTAELADAIDSGAALRGRLSLQMREEIPPAVQSASTIGVRVEMGWHPAQLVRFGGAGADGNPSRRDVRPVHIPVARGLALRAP